MSLIERVMESETLSEETKQRFVDGWILGRVRAEEREQLKLARQHQQAAPSSKAVCHRRSDAQPGTSIGGAK